MARIETEDTRRQQLIEATIDTLAEEGFAATTLAEIGSRAHVSPGLISHYFADKDGLLEATLRNLAARLARGVSERLRTAQSPRQRVQAVIDATLAPEEFEPRTCSVWLAFWGQVIHSERLRRVQRIYQRRMLSDLKHALKQIMPGEEAERVAIGLAAMIDGLWLRATLSSPHETDSRAARAMAAGFVDAEIARHVAAKPAARPQAGWGTAGNRVRNHIGGATVDARSRKTFTTINPATGETLAEIEIAGAAEVELAVDAAKAAQPKWAAMTGAERGRTLRRVADILRARNDELARLETLDTGKP
ncbi:MAG: transcriptional regulator BetI, partial [Bauldia sp.]|nr:transcriptional regulator BetI [Bauldia sp.]